MIEHYDYEDVIHGAAASAAARYPAEISDLKQEIYLEFYTDSFQKKLAKLLDEAGEEDGDSTRYVQGMAHRIAGRYGKEEKIQRYGFEPNEMARYSEPTVRKMLVPFFQWKGDGTLPNSGPQHGQPSSGTPANQKGVVQAMLCDMSRAWDVLDNAARQALFLAGQFGDQPDWEKISEQIGVTPDAARKRHQRAVERMTKFLNEFRTRAEMEHHGIGSRRVRSNAQAQHETSRGWS